ncbi:hypothetical protein BOX15_Mlig032649g1 [Macrostomum lignano]|uniref:Uncharacterized protein n=1 Tax=Macrostomum lignano TaxID=282301 RepID=A0A267GYR1_9PLAT|nr:hypothetical protein BOX15_Mlig032649g1 [Macrostomum lignano]
MAKNLRSACERSASAGYIRVPGSLWITRNRTASAASFTATWQLSSLDWIARLQKVKIARTQPQLRLQKVKIARTQPQLRLQKVKIARTQPQLRLQKVKIARTQPQLRLQKVKIARTQPQLRRKDERDEPPPSMAFECVCLWRGVGGVASRRYCYLHNAFANE